MRWMTQTSRNFCIIYCRKKKGKLLAMQCKCRNQKRKRRLLIIHTKLFHPQFNCPLLPPSQDRHL